MENGVICMENLDGSSELGTIPVIVRWENGRLGLRVDAEDESFDGLIGRESLSLEERTGDE